MKRCAKPHSRSVSQGRRRPAANDRLPRVADETYSGAYQWPRCHCHTHGRRLYIWLGALSKKRPHAVERAILLKGTFYAKGSLPAYHKIGRCGVMALGRRLLSRRRGSYASTARSYHNIRANCGEGRTKCCDRVYNPNGIAVGGVCPVF